jgi:hypothetical protein
VKGNAECTNLGSKNIGLVEIPNYDFGFIAAPIQALEQIVELPL